MGLLSSIKRKDNIIEVANELLSLQKVKVTATGLEHDLQRHPDYPSLLSLSDTFTSYGIENVAVKSSKKKIEDYPFPLVVPIYYNEQQKLTVVRKATAESVDFFNPDKLTFENLKKEAFNQIWRSGVAMLLNAEEAHGEKEYDLKRKRERSNIAVKVLSFGALPLLTILASVWAIYTQGSMAISASLFTLTTLIGLVTTSLLIWLEVDENSPVLQQICKAGKKMNCNAVVTSKASKVLGVSWGSIGFVYFAGSLILLLTQGMTNPSTFLFLAWLSLLALPYTIFSITYQWKVAKQWCALCLVVQALLALQAIIVLQANWHQILPTGDIAWSISLIPLTASFLIPSIVLYVALPAFTGNKLGKENFKELQRFKHNPQIFGTLLEKQRSFTESTDGLGITIGNENPKYKIVKICHPYCNPCAKAHSPMEELLHNNPEVQLQIIFIVSEQSGDKALPVKHLMAIQEKFGEAMTRKALDDWYLSPEKDYEAFSKKYPMNGEVEKQASKIELMHSWCDKSQISFTPTFVINGHQLPEMYNANDLKYLLSV